MVATAQAMQGSVSARRGAAPATPSAQSRMSASRPGADPSRVWGAPALRLGRGIPGNARAVSAQVAAADVETISKEGQV